VSDPGGPVDAGAEPDAETVAAAALSCAGVHALTRGSDVVEIATYLPGRRVHGVRVGPGRAEVHIVTEYGANMVEVAERVRSAVSSAVTAGTARPAPQIDVYVDDIFGPDIPEPQRPEAAQEAQETQPPGVPGEVS
jgi:uncharacterized alkaline shock family protein YloU